MHACVIDSFYCVNVPPICTMIPCLTQKIWYAFQGLPIERVGSVDRLPWPKCLVLTNNLMYILQLKQLTETFKKTIIKAEAELNKGVTFAEYITFLEDYLKDQQKATKSYDQITNEGSHQSTLDPLTFSESQKRPRGHTTESQSTETRPLNVNTCSKSDPGISPFIRTFDDYCWTLYRTKNLTQLSSQSSLHNGFFNLWLLFLTYSTKDIETGQVEVPVTMDLIEARYWCSRIREILGARRQFEDADIEEHASKIQFTEFYLMVQDIFKSTNLDEKIVEIALSDLADEALEGVIMKGAIKVDRYTRFCVLKSFVLLIYNNKVSATNLRSSVVILPDTELLAGTHKIQIKSFDHAVVTTITVEITDIQLFNKWRSAFTDAIDFSKKHIVNPAIKEAEIREEGRRIKRSAIRMKRMLLEEKLEQERKERSEVTEAMERQLHLADKELNNCKQKIEKELNEKEMLIKENEDIRKETEDRIKDVLNEKQMQYKMQLEMLKEIENDKNCLNEMLQATMEEKINEEMKRALLEEKHLEAQHILQEAEEKIQSLERISEQLQKALEEERQAKEEEETVRNATLLLLEEEQRSKQKLEDLLQQQNNMMNQEIQKSNEFADQLENERNKIKNIADEKEKLTKQLEDTREKMKSTGIRVRKLDTKVTQIADTIFGKNEVRVPVSHRGQGFIAEIMVQPRRKKEAEEPCVIGSQAARKDPS